MVYDYQYIQQDNVISASVLILSDTKSMFSNSINVPVAGQRTDEEKIADKQKFAEVLADQALLNSFRSFILLQSDLSEDTLDKYYSMSD